MKSRCASRHKKMRDLSINIKMKEQLIKELVKSSRDAHSMNEQYKEKISAMEKVKHIFGQCIYGECKVYLWKSKGIFIEGIFMEKVRYVYGKRKVDLYIWTR